MGRRREKSFKLYLERGEDAESNPSNMVRFTDDDGLGIDLHVGHVASKGVKATAEAGYTSDELSDQHENGRSQFDATLRATLWVEVVDSWEKDGNWGGYLKVACEHQKGKYIDSKHGWLHVYSSKYDKVTFVDKGDYYEIWQRDYGTGRPLGVDGNKLRFMDDKSKAEKWNIKD